MTKQVKIWNCTRITPVSLFIGCCNISRCNRKCHHQVHNCVILKSHIYLHNVKMTAGFIYHLSRLYWCNLPLFPFWKECTILGIWNSCWIMHYALHALGPSYKSLLCIYWRPCISSSRFCCCLLCLWISQCTKNKVQSSGMHFESLSFVILSFIAFYFPWIWTGWSLYIYRRQFFLKKSCNFSQLL